jgi:hypothetical protein
MQAAIRHVAWAAMAVSTERFSDRAAAFSAIHAHRELLVAAGGHLLFLAGGPYRGEGLVSAPDPADRPALALSRALQSLQARDNADRDQGRGGPAQSWVAAGKALGAARDLVATHRDARGADRTPDAGVLDDGAERAAGYLLVADLVDTVAAAERDLALRAAQAGIAWSTVERSMPELTRVSEAVRVLRMEAAYPASGATRLARLPLARPGVTSPIPAGALLQRTDRLRLGAWTLARHPRRANAADLVEYAAAAAILHTHLAAHASALEDPALAAVWSQQRMAWVGQHRLLARFTSGTPATPGLRADVAALPASAAIALPLTRDAAGIRAYGPAQLSPALMQRLSAACTEIAVTNQTTLRALLDRDALFIDARYLTGDQVTDHTDLIEAKMAGRYVPAAASDLAPALAGYTSLAGAQPTASTFPPERAPADRLTETRRVDRPTLEHT